MLNRKKAPQYYNIQPLVFSNIDTCKLDNGITTYYLNGGSQELVRLEFVYPAGSRYSQQPLVAPFTSMMLHEGTLLQQAQQIAEGFDFYGAHFIPSTEKDNAFVGLLTLNKHIEKTFGLLADVITNSIFPQQRLDSLRARRLQNFLIESEKTSFLAREYFYQNLFGSSHYYGTANKTEFYNQIDVNTLKQFYNNNYRNTAPQLIVSGYITDNVKHAVNKYFGQIGFNNLPGAKTTLPQVTSNFSLQVINKPDAVQSSLRCGFLTVNKQHPDYLGLKVLSTILGGYFGSRLMKNVREDKGLTYGIHAIQVSLYDAGYMIIGADVKSQNTRQAVDEIIIEIDKLKNTPVSTDELSLVQNFMMGDMLQMFDGPFAKAESFKNVVQYNFDFSYYQKMQQTILSITPGQLLQLANKYYNTDKMVKVVAGVY